MNLIAPNICWWSNEIVKMILIREKRKKKDKGGRVGGSCKIDCGEGGLGWSCHLQILNHYIVESPLSLYIIYWQSGRY